MRRFATRRSAKFPALAILLLGLTGCALTPLETTPKPDSPTAWRVEAATAEQAAYELAKPAEKVSILVQYNPESEFDIY